MGGAGRAVGVRVEVEAEVGAGVEAEVEADVEADVEAEVEAEVDVEVRLVRATAATRQEVVAAARQGRQSPAPLPQILAFLA